jgi:hypothetical protein
MPDEKVIVAKPAKKPAKKPTEETNIQSLLKLAVTKGVDADQLDKLLTLKERVDDRKAAQEFAEALSSFQDQCPVIPKASTAKVVGRSGAAFTYQFADLDTIVRVIRPELRMNGLSFSWDSKTTDKMIMCICTLTHVNGHKETASFECPTDSKAGMSEQQKVASALTFARRQSLVQVLGLTVTDPDEDGGEADYERISAGQVADIEALISEVGADDKRFLKFMKVECLEDILASHYSMAVKALERKRQ